MYWAIINRFLRATAIAGVFAIGPANVALADAAANKALIRDYMTMLFVDKKVAEAAALYADPNLIQHNPNLPDGAAAVVAFLGGMLEENPAFRYDIKRIIAEDDLVVVHAHVTMSPQHPGLAVFDLFRVADGKVVEHWDVLQPIPEKAMNSNTMF